MSEDLGLARSENQLIDLLWAKTDPHKDLLSHMIDAGCCAKAYLESPASSALVRFLSAEWNFSGEEAVSFAAYLTAMHDIGKASPQFQMQSDEELKRLRETELGKILPERKPGHTRHEYLSQSIANRIWKTRGTDRRLRNAYACILSLHHQKVDTSESHKHKVHESWQSMQDEIEGIIRKIFGFSGKLPHPKHCDPVCILLTGIQILCDWTASSGTFDGLSGNDPAYSDKSLAMARSAMKRYGLVECHEMKTVDSFSDLWPKILSPRDIQKKCGSLAPDAPLTIIEAPMGEGKTEAALYQAVRARQAFGRRGIYTALPTQATSNQMYGRFADMMKTVQDGHTRLLHGTAFLMKDETDEIQSEDAPEAEKWLGSSRMGLLDENGVGTVDQAMAAVLRAKFSVLRMLGLVNKVLIIDELHAYDAYMSEIIESLLHWCRALSIPVILLSATLQNSQRQRYLSCFTGAPLPELSGHYPLLTQVLEDETVVQTEAEATMQTEYTFAAEPMGLDEEKTVRLALDKIRNGGCICILTNTVKRAQNVYRKLRELRDADMEIMLFHAAFPMGRREEIEKECIRRFGKGAGADRPARAVLVATQVVEQSLDIDFDGMISDLAPVDLLLQRAGRLHRHRDRKRPSGLEEPVLHVILPEEEAAEDLEKRYGPSGYVYAPFLLYNTEKLLEKGRTVRVPQDVRSVIEQVYERVTEENFEAWQKRAFGQQLESANAAHAAFPVPADDTFFPAQSHAEFEDLNVDDGFEPSARAATRLGDPTFRIAFTDEEHLECIRAGRLSREQRKEILLSSVSLRLTPDVREELFSGAVLQIQRGALNGCFVADLEKTLVLGGKKLINDQEIGIYWEDV